MLEWGEKNRRRFPWRTERNPYTTLLAEILLQRTPAHRVAEFFPTFIKKFPTPHAIIMADSTEFQTYLASMGLKKRAQWLRSIMQDICDRNDCKIPQEEKELLALRGIGPYTARAVLCFGFGKDVGIVDINVARVLSRVFLGTDVERKPAEDKIIWKLAEKLIPKNSGLLYNEALLDFASLICKKTPQHSDCSIKDICRYFARKKHL
jgi:A/G-specific adenine glycosylase